jgi:hypothetical protein
MENKEVKIIGIKVNTQMGILQSCHLQFDVENRLIAVKGEVGSGKTTLQKSLSLGTKGSDTLKHDKGLYGDIDQEVQLLDEGINVFVGCKTNKKGGLDYTVFTKDSNGKIVKDPVIGGVKLTPGEYLKSLQTALTWRMDEITSESLVVQKKILLELYKNELAKVGVIFDKTSVKYADSILGKIELAENDRSEKEFLRKQVGGFANQLEPLGIYIDNPDTLPKWVDISDLESKKNTISFSIENVEKVKEQKLQGLKNAADSVILQLKDLDGKVAEENKANLAAFEVKKQQYSQNTHTKNGLFTDLKTLNTEGCLCDGSYSDIQQLIHGNFTNDAPMCLPEKKRLEFNDEGRLISLAASFEGDTFDKINQLNVLKADYRKISKEPKGSTESHEKDLAVVVENMRLAKEVNRKCDMVKSYTNWSVAHKEVLALRDEYAQLLSNVNTGVEGLQINVDKEDGKLEIYLSYDGTYDPVYFGNKTKEQRKLSSYSGTQKPMICLLLQNYLLSKKPKALRYLWVDNVPIDSKTKLLLNKMGEELGMTIIVNITGDFSKNTLESGEILIEGGEVFFNELTQK